MIFKRKLYTKMLDWKAQSNGKTALLISSTSPWTYFATNTHRASATESSYIQRITKKKRPYNMCRCILRGWCEEYAIR